MTVEAPEILRAHYLKTLKLPTFQREYQKLARLCATEGVDHVGYLFRLSEREMIERDRRKVERRIKATKFPVVKSLDSFDFAAIPKLNKMQVLELARNGSSVGRTSSLSAPVERMRPPLGLRPPAGLMRAPRWSTFARRVAGFYSAVDSADSDVKPAGIPI